MKFIVSAADPLGDLLWFTWALLSPNFDLCESVCESIEFAVCVCVNFKLFDQFDDPLMNPMDHQADPCVNVVRNV